MKKEVKIVLPENIYILKSKPQVNLANGLEEFNIYFENIISPYKADYDVLVECNYGMNLGRSWTINTFPDDARDFPITIRVYDEYGELLAEKSAEIHLVDKKRYENPINVLCIGDSMTRGQIYMENILHKLHKVSFVGTRSLDGIIYHEGRGGWTFANYFSKAKAGTSDTGISPFVFPKNVAAKDYAGDYRYIELTQNDNLGDYYIEGLTSKPISDGQYFLKDGALYKRENDGDILIEEEAEMEFSFPKYMEKNENVRPDVISILLGANDLQVCSYENSDMRVDNYVASYQRFIDSIREYDKNIPIVINLPAISGDNYHWGLMKKRTGAKTFKFNILKGAERLLNFESEENIYISPMLSCIDIQNGFAKLGFKANKYTETVEIHQNNWVHPNESGYRQMGDALAPIIEKIHSELEGK